MRRASQVLLWVSAVAAAAAGVFAVPDAAAADPAVRLVEFWRAFGLLLFAGLFTVLSTGRAPAAVWWLVLGHKLALTVTAVVLATDGVPGAWTVAAVDGALTAVVLLAWLTRGPLIPPTSTWSRGTVLHTIDTPTGPVAVREAGRADVPAIVGLLLDDGLGRGRESLDDLTPYLEAFDVVDRDPSNLLVVLADGDRIVGTLQLTFLAGLSQRGATRAQIEAVRVAADRRGGGLGTAFIVWAVEESRRRGCRLVQLTSHESRTDAHRFYERLGFHATHVGMKLPL